MNRRTFLKLGLGAGGAGLILYVAFENRYSIIAKVMNYMDNKDFDANAFIFVQPNGIVKIICHRSEMGQGVRTSMSMIMADELDVSWEQIEIIQADGDSKYGSQNTDGSKSVRDFWIPLRTAAAAAREMLKQAAALGWEVKIEDCYTTAGRVVHRPTQKEIGYGDLVLRASTLEVPKNPPLKNPDDFHIIGKPKIGIDVKAISMGTTTFGIDIDIPRMKYAALLRAPVPGAKIISVNDTLTKKVKGVSRVVPLEEQGASINTNNAIAVIADNTWAAFQGRNQLKVEWDYSGLKLESSEDYKKELKQSLKKGLKTFRKDGHPWINDKSNKKKVKSVFNTPYLIHAPMEPLVSTASVTKEGCEVWAPSQDPQRSMKDIANVLGIDKKNIKFHVTFLGGGFGRKSHSDFVLESVLLSKKINAPVKLQWSREDEIRHGFYHAESYQELEVGLDGEGYPQSWVHKTTFPTIVKTFMPIAKTPADWEVGMAASNIPYQIKNIECSAGTIESSLRIGWLRSVCNLWHCFAVESFVDELAHIANFDPIAYRLKLLGAPRVIDDGTDYPQNTGRMIKVIEKVKKEFGWDKELSASRGKGFASQFSFFSYVATAMEVSVKDNDIKAERVITCIDCGLAVNPDSVKAQMEGAVIFGLSAALHGKITLDKGKVIQSNFHDYPVLRMSESPKIEVHIINGDVNKPTGVGEPGVPPVAPALSNAIFSASGKRLRELPLRLS